MPELPEVETIRRGLNNLTINQKNSGGRSFITQDISLSPRNRSFLAGYYRHGESPNGSGGGKYLYARLTDLDSNRSAGWLGVHLRMTGQLLWVTQEDSLQKHTRIRWFF